MLNPDCDEIELKRAATSVETGSVTRLTEWALHDTLAEVHKESKMLFIDYCAEDVEFNR